MNEIYAPMLVLSEGKTSMLRMWIICGFQQIDSLTMRFDLKLYAVKFTLSAGSCTLYCTKSATVRTSKFQASFLPLKIGFLSII